MREINLDQLRTLITIADTGSFNEAARQLHLAPPTVSLHISELGAIARDTPLKAAEAVEGSLPAVSPTGIAVLERSWQVGGPELVGSIAPTTAREVASLTAALTTRGGVSISAPLAKSGPSGGICPVSKV